MEPKEKEDSKKSMDLHEWECEGMGSHEDEFSETPSHEDEFSGYDWSH